MIKPTASAASGPLVTENTPQLTINHDVAADLNSANAFEGPEKLLEVWFAPSAERLPPGVKPDGLKSVPSDVWTPMLDDVHCEVLSVLRMEDGGDAYLLSESSMFVYPNKVVLKTCGTTTLLFGLRKILYIAAVHAGFPFHNAKCQEDEHVAASPYQLFYSRKNFLYPDKQRGPHRSWREEVKFLEDLFTGGRAYMIGPMNGDHWYLYMLKSEPMLTPPRTPDGPTGSGDMATKIPTAHTSAFQGAAVDSDETLEILMTDLDPESAKQFYLDKATALADASYPLRTREARQAIIDSLGDLSAGTDADGSVADESADETLDALSSASEAVLTPLTPLDSSFAGHALGTLVSDHCGLSDVYPTTQYPDAKIDAYMFKPCGFSANGVIPARRNQDSDVGGKVGHYFTVHVTPEPTCSYASFETNVPGGQNGRETSEVIEQVVGIFKPGRFSVTLFVAKGSRSSCADVAPAGVVRTNKPVERMYGYRRTDRIVHDFDDYELIFRAFQRVDWVGGTGVRVGEDMEL